MRRRVLLAPALLLVPVLAACSSAATTVATITVKAGSGTCEATPITVTV